ncbi:serpin (serine protease inhibitor) domain-containing protein [Phthorimaea operculella]|nr:serpin (serine protease inhibitor) domain-containing protein [Phthorimaea operculella]
MKILLLTTILAAATMADEKALQDALQKGNNRFTANMFSEVVKANPGKSVVMSAFSVLTPLAQLALASEGPSHDQLLRAIGMKDDNETKEVFGYVNKNLRSVKGVELKMASRIYIGKDFTIDDHFQDVSRELFGSEVKKVDFAENSKTANEINVWVEDQTNHKIKDLVSPDSLDSSTTSVLVNAIYFKGHWVDKFDPTFTKDEDFHITKDETVKVPMMHRKGEYSYADSAELNAKLLRLPYEGYEASMLIILPNEIDGLAALEEKLKDPEAISRATQNMYTHEVTVSLPRFKIETTTDLKDILTKMDVTKIFTSDARLTHLLKGVSNIAVSSAKQKAFIEVNEEGAEAAAANAFQPMFISAPINKQVDFRADHPYMFAIMKDEVTLFEGVYEKK